MPCYGPLKGYRADPQKNEGKRGITFNAKRGFVEMPISIPCGQCLGCRLEKSRQWAVRCMHEASLYPDNCFVTLTFDDAHLTVDRQPGNDPNYSLDVRDTQKFMKRLRKKYGSGVRYYGCGEYGENTRRAHYHICLFNHDFSDKRIWKESGDNLLFRSATLETLWPYGHVSIGALTFQSAAYTARYVLKKQTGDHAQNHYEFVDPYGEIHDLQPEFSIMSRKPGIGIPWLQKYGKEVIDNDNVIVDGKRQSVPAAYDRFHKEKHRAQLEATKRKRKKGLQKNLDNLTSRRLRVREQVQEARMTTLKRTIS